MANPSLQIGNSNWAIKEDNLLGYSTAGTRFIPQPITMTRASAGTRVNPQGLVETVELLGSELITDGSFPTGTTAWTISGGNADITNGLLNFTNAASYGTSITNSSSVFSSISYVVQYTISDYSSGSAQIRLGSQFGVERSANGTYTETIVSNGTLIRIYPSSANTTLSIDNVSVKESTKNNLARVDYDGTASSLLIEPQRTNIVTYSQNFTNGNFWDFQGASQIDNSIISPNGTQNADKFYPSSTGNFRGLAKPFGSTLNAAAYTLSAFVKKGGKDFFFFYNLGSPQGSGGVWFNINTGVIGSVGSAYSNVKIENVGNGWFRCSATLNYGGTNDYSYLLMSDSNGSLTATVNGTDGIYLWGTQIEEASSYATSYIPTDGSTVTRVQDQYSKTGISNLINSEEGVLFVEMALLSDDGSNKYITLTTVNGSNKVQIDFDYSSSRLQYLVASGGLAQCNIKIPYSGTNMDKLAFKWKENDFAVWINGVEIGSDTSGLAPIGLNTLKFSSPTDSNTFFGKVKQLQVFKTALTDSELATLTTI